MRYRGYRIAILASLGFLSVLSLEAREVHAATVRGQVDQLVPGANGSYSVSGWTCALGRAQSIAADLYLGAAWPQGTFQGRFIANKPSEPAVAAACGSTGATYRFLLPLTAETRLRFAGKPIYVHGIDPDGGLNPVLGGSGRLTVPGDAQPPTVTAFTVPASSNNLVIAPVSLAATDDLRVAGYLITESPTPPLASAAGWSATPPTSFTLSSPPHGRKALYAWAKDAAGKVSSPRAAAVLPRPVAGDFFGLHILHSDPNDDNLTAENLALGFKTIRLWDVGTTWRMLQPTPAPIDPASPAVAKLDRYVAAARAQGLDIILCLGQTPPWAWPADFWSRPATPEEPGYTYQYELFLDAWSAAKTYRKDELVLYDASTASTAKKRKVFRSRADGNFGQSPDTPGSPYWDVHLESPVAAAGSWPTHGPWAPESPESLQAWDNYVQFLIDRYGTRIKYFELWNEPNMLTFYRGGTGQLAELTRRVRARIGAKGAAAIQLIGASVTNTPQDALHPDAPDTYLGKYLAAAAPYLDFVGVHSYVSPAPPEHMIPLLDSFKLAAARNGAGHLPVWNTEVGALDFHDKTGAYRLWSWSNPQTMSEMQAVSYLYRTLLANWIAGVDRMNFYAFDTLTMPFTRAIPYPASKPLPKIHTNTRGAYRKIIDWMLGRRVESYSSSNGTFVLNIADSTGKRETLAWHEDFREGQPAKPPFPVPNASAAMRQFTAFGTTDTLSSSGTATLSMIPSLFSTRADLLPTPLTGDDTPPTGSVIMSADMTRLTLQATDASGVAAMQLSRDGSSWYGWEPYSPSRTIQRGVMRPGCNVIYVRFLDSRGNVSAASFDFVNGSGGSNPLLLNDCATTSPGPTGKLLLKKPDADEMILSWSATDWSHSRWEPYRPIRALSSVPVTTPSGMPKTIYVKFRKFGGSESAVFSDSVLAP